MKANEQTREDLHRQCERLADDLTALAQQLEVSFDKEC